MTSFEAGVFLVDKQIGITSFRVVQHIRRALGIKKVGHTGTLDPFASGLLIVCAGRPATRIIQQLMEGSKKYEALLQLGIETDTQDIEGKIIAQRTVEELDPKQISCCLTGFVGEQLQKPPAFSALKHKGKPLYHYARQGIMIEKEARKIEIKKIECLSIEQTCIAIKVECSKGTYIRTLAADIGQDLGYGAHLKALRRTKNGPFAVEKAICSSKLQEKEPARALLLQNYMSVEDALASIS